MVMVKQKDEMPSTPTFSGRQTEGGPVMVSPGAIGQDQPLSRDGKLVLPFNHDMTMIAPFIVDENMSPAFPLAILRTVQFLSAHTVSLRLLAHPSC